MARILFVEFLQLVADQIKPVLQRDGHEVTWTISGQQAVRRWSNEGFDVLLMNFRSDDLNAEEVLTHLQSKGETPYYAVIYSAAFDTVLRRIQELRNLMSQGELVLIPRYDETFYRVLRETIANIPITLQKEEA